MKAIQEESAADPLQSQEELEECLSDLQQARASFNEAFHAMFPPPGMIGLWDQIQAWVDSEARGIMGVQRDEPGPAILAKGGKMGPEKCDFCGTAYYRDELLACSNCRIKACRDCMDGHWSTDAMTCSECAAKER